MHRGDGGQGVGIDVDVGNWGDGEHPGGEVVLGGFLLKTWSVKRVNFRRDDVVPLRQGTQGGGVQLGREGLFGVADARESDGKRLARDETPGRCLDLKPQRDIGGAGSVGADHRSLHGPRTFEGAFGGDDGQIALETEVHPGGDDQLNLLHLVHFRGFLNDVFCIGGDVNGVCTAAGSDDGGVHPR